MIVDNKDGIALGTSLAFVNRSRVKAKAVAKIDGSYMFRLMDLKKKCTKSFGQITTAKLRTAPLEVTRNFELKCF